MAHNPYEAPESRVADPIVPDVPCPPEVTRAVRILWISLAASLATMLPVIRGNWWAPDGGENAPDAGPVVIVFALVMFALSAWLVWMVSRGRNWARWTLLGLFVIGWLFLLTDFSRSLAETPLAALADTLIAAAEVWACYLLFSGAGAAWFTRGQ